MGLWVDDLLIEYKHYKKELQQLKKSKILSAWDKKNINSMIEEMEYVIKWLETGSNPKQYRGFDKKGAYHINALAVYDIIPDITEQLDDADKKHLFLTPWEKENLQKIFAVLSVRERQCYIMNKGQEMSWEKIAKELGVGKTTVRSYLERAQMKINEINK